MNEIRGTQNSGVDSDYYSTPPVDTATAQKIAASDKKEAEIQTISSTSLSPEEEIQQQIDNDPELKALFNSVMANFDQTPETTFDIRRVIFALIALTQELQRAAMVCSDSLMKVTEKLTAYSTMMTQVPVVLKDQATYSNEGKDNSEKLRNDSDARALANQKFANMLEAVRANKGLEEDKAKKIQTLLQSMKDASTSASDFITAFIDLLRGISSKIFR